MIGYRRAAVALHELHEADRDWILGELLPEDRNALSNCLAEIKELGFASNQSFANEAMVRSYGETAVSTPLERLRSASAEDVYTVLKGESPVLIARLLKITDWPWTSQFMTQFGDAIQARLRELLSAATLTAPSLAEHLIIEVAGRLPGEKDVDSSEQVGGIGASIKKIARDYLARWSKSRS